MKLQNIEVVAGADTALDFDVEDDAASLGIADYEVHWALWSLADDGMTPSGTPVLSKVTGGSGITIVDATEQTFTVALTAAETADLLRNYYHEAWLVDTVGNITPVTYGFCTFLAAPRAAASAALSATNLRMRFPEFADVSAYRIEMALAQAQLVVGESWIETDRASATAFLAAHYLMSSGALTEGGYTTVTGPIQSERLGDASVTYANYAQNMSGFAAELTTTPYGLRYLTLQRQSHPAVAYIV